MATGALRQPIGQVQSTQANAGRGGDTLLWFFTKPPAKTLLRDSQMEKNLAENPVPIIGAWKLVSFESRQDNGEVIYPFGEDAQGSIIYTATGRFSVQLMRTNRPRFVSADQMKGTVEEIEANYKGCISYYGSYEFAREGGFVVHHVEGSLFPNWEGQGLKRFCVLTGNRLTLTTQPILWGGGGEIVGVVEWERVG
jgi:hypothetical protein